MCGRRRILWASTGRLCSGEAQGSLGNLESQWGLLLGALGKVESQDWGVGGGYRGLSVAIGVPWGYERG